MLNRRRFLQCLTAAAALPPGAAACSGAAHGFGALRPDPRQLLDLPNDQTDWQTQHSLLLTVSYTLIERQADAEAE